MTPEEPLSPMDEYMLDKWCEMQARIRAADATGFHGIPETLATLNRQRINLKPLEERK